jgi:hypothetical protein
MCKDWIRESKSFQMPIYHTNTLFPKHLKIILNRFPVKKISTVLSRKSILSCIQTEARQSYFHQEGSFNSTKKL